MLACILFVRIAQDMDYCLSFLWSLSTLSYMLVASYFEENVLKKTEITNKTLFTGMHKVYILYT